MTKSNLWLLILCLFVITVVSLGTVLILGRRNIYKPGVSTIVDKAVGQARKVYEEKKDEGIDFSNGPCLSNDLIKGWVLDLVHEPRTAVDSKPEYQCAALREGRATHFVEMDLEGNVIRVK